MPDIQPRSADVAKVPRRNIIGAVTLVLVAIAVVGVTISTALGIVQNSAAAKLDRQNQFNTCARSVAAEFEDQRDQFLLAIDRNQVSVAQQDFRAFLTNPKTGELENRAERTVRMCGTP
jgi:hypothetical protein